MPDLEDDAPNEPRRLGEDPPPDAPEMIPPEPALFPPEPPAERKKRSKHSRLALVVMVAIVVALALGGGTAAYFLLEEDEAFKPVGTDLTEGLEPFDPDEAEGYHPFTLERDSWIPQPQGSEWTLQELGDTSATFHKELGDDTVVLICGDIRDSPERYPADFTDHAAWFAAEEARSAEYHSPDDQFGRVAGPDYGDYVIDGRQAFLVEVQYRWTQWDDPESGPTEVDYTRAHAYLYIDRGDLPAARCSVTAHHGATDGYDEAVAALLGIRLEAAQASD